jgi:aminoglycoside 3-N-acetyltransferase I
MQPEKQELQITRLHKDDGAIAAELFILMQRVFGIETPTLADEAYIKALLADDHFICFAVRHQDRLAGGLTAYQLPMVHAATSEIFIYDIAFLPEFQRMGYGKRLMETVKAFAKEKRYDLFVDADAEDHHALEFYRAAGGSESRVLQYSFYFNKPVLESPL